VNASLCLGGPDRPPRPFLLSPGLRKSSVPAFTLSVLATPLFNFFAVTEEQLACALIPSPFGPFSGPHPGDGQSSWKARSRRSRTTAPLRSDSSRRSENIRFFFGRLHVSLILLGAFSFGFSLARLVRLQRRSLSRIGRCSAGADGPSPFFFRPCSSLFFRRSTDPSQAWPSFCANAVLSRFDDARFLV